MPASRIPVRTSTEESPGAGQKREFITETQKKLMDAGRRRQLAVDRKREAARLRNAQHSERMRKEKERRGKYDSPDWIA